MPKMKTHSGAKKRFRVTGTGKVRTRHSFTSHKFVHKSPRRKRYLDRSALLPESEARHVRRLMPYSF